MEYFLLPILLFVLSFISGMLGLGVAFISTPVLGLFGFDLKHDHALEPAFERPDGHQQRHRFHPLEDGGLAHRSSIAGNHHAGCAARRVDSAFRSDEHCVVDLRGGAVVSGLSHGFRPQTG